MRTFLFALIGLVIVTGTNPVGRAAAQDRDSSTTVRPNYQLLRQEEDWSPMQDQQYERGLASLKYIPLTEDASFLTVGGEVRSYARWFQNEQWGQASRRDGYLLQRLMLHGSAKTEEITNGVYIRTFAQLKSGLVAGRDGPIYPPDKDVIDVNQAFLEIGTSYGRSRELMVRMGRQELHYGAGRMIAAREGPNVRFGYDAILGRYQDGPWGVDAFLGKPNETNPGVLDNGWMPGRSLWGVYLQRNSQSGPALSLYYFGTKRNSSPLGRITRAIRHTLGGRTHGAMGRAEYDLEGAFQLGSYRRGYSPSVQQAITAGSPTLHSIDGPVRAWMLAGRISYRVPTAAMQPTLGLMADMSSGDDVETETMETFLAPYPSGRYTGAGSRLGPGNLLNVRPFLSLWMRFDLQIQFGGHIFWRSRTTDGIYAIWGAPLLRPPDTEDRNVGVMPEVLLTWDAERHLNLALEASHFYTGAVLRESLGGRGMTHLGLRATYVF